MPHINEKYDFTITVFIVSESKKVLLVNHPRYNKWIPIGGHIELDEDPEEALYREIKEETSLEVEILSTKPNITSTGTKFILSPNYVDVHEANPPHKHISFTYFAKSKGESFTISDEHDDMKWFSTEELRDKKYNLSEAVIFYSLEALKLV
ncbi:MAG: NUDIX domain-containing protein [Candidatus Saccharimonadales bacterium]